MKDLTQNKTFAVTIDGPAGAGKTTTAKALAERLPGFRYVDTGAFYRALAVFSKETEDENWLEKAHGNVRAVPDGDRGQSMQIRRDGEWIAIPDSVLRAPEVSELASLVSSHPSTRAFANELIREYAAGTDVVMEGRDTGSAVLPDANVKFYLTAGVAVRAKRRYQDQDPANGIKTVDEIQKGIVVRDERDSSRAADPLKIPDGAIEMDNSNMSAEETVDVMLNIVTGTQKEYARRNAKKIAWFDMDGTVVAPVFQVNGITRIGFHGDKWPAFCDMAGSDSYALCKPVTEVINFARQLKALGFDNRILTCAMSEGERAAKIKWVETTPGMSEIFSDIVFPNSPEDKIPFILAQWPTNQDLVQILVEDDYRTICLAIDRGICPVHVSHIMNNQALELIDGKGRMPV